MKKPGSIFEYEEERNDDLMRCYEAQRRQNCKRKSHVIYAATVAMPSKRFWVSEERAALVVSSLMRGDKLEKMGRMKKEMYLEIYRRVLEARKDSPGESIYNLTFDVVNSPAPKFYLTPGSAKVIINYIKRGWYRERRWYIERRRRLRH